MDIPQPIDSASIETWSDTADVLVVGFGVAGASAALEARSLGADVIVLERAGAGGGTSALSCGIFYLGGGTAVQRACDQPDDAENMFRFLSASLPETDPIKIRRFADDSADHFDWLEAQGIPFERTRYDGKAMFLMSTECLLSTGNEFVWPFSEAARPVYRGHATAAEGETAGADAMRALIQRCDEIGVRPVYDANVTQLIVASDGAVSGVRYRKEGRDYDVRARKGVILASGGFSINTDMVDEYIKDRSVTGVPLGSAYADGFGIRLGQSAGGSIEAMDGVIFTGSFYPPEQLIKGILVNQHGERFVAEDSYHGRTAGFLREQPNQVGYLIVDEEIFAYPELEFIGHRLVDGWETVAEMEAGLSIATGALQATLDRYNADAAKGVDDQFHKAAKWIKPLTKGPYAAFDVSITRSGYWYLTLGGLRTNADGQVLDQAGKPVPRLYAAGGASASLARTGKGYASGLSLSEGSYFGRRAARKAYSISTLGEQTDAAQELEVRR